MEKNIFIYVLLLTAVTLAQCKKDETTTNNTDNNCAVTAYSDTLQNVFVYLYDNNGRVITDSTPGGYNTTYITYVDNTVSCINSGTNLATITLNSAGMPTSSNINYSFGGAITYQAAYNTDGTLNSIITTGADTIAYNVVYAGGNIISAIANGIPVTYQYYTNLTYTPYDPTAKFFAASDNWGYEIVTGTSGNFNPQPFSKNLLKYASSMDGPYDSNVNFTYQTDSKGAVTYLNRVDSAGNSYSAHFAYNNCP